MEDIKSIAAKSKVAAYSQTWPEALRRVQTLGPIPSSFSVCVRQLMAGVAEAPADNPPTAKLEENAQFLLKRFLRSPSILGHVYFLTRTFRQDLIDAHPTTILLDDVLRFYSPREWASIISLVYLIHCIRPHCDDQEWTTLAKLIQESADIGGVLGGKIPTLGFGDGILIAGMRWLALTLCTTPDLRRFQNYRRHVLKERNGFDLALEIKNWGCAHPQIAALLLMQMGFPAEYTILFEAALAASPKAKLTPDINRLRLLSQWSYALQAGIPLPSLPGENDYLTTDIVLDEVAKASTQVAEMGSAHSWLIRTSQDVPPEDACRLEGFEEAKSLIKQRRKRTAAKATQAQESKEDFTVAASELPEHLQKHFPKGALDELRAEIGELLTTESTPKPDEPPA